MTPISTSPVKYRLMRRYYNNPRIKIGPALTKLDRRVEHWLTKVLRFIFGY